MKYFVKYLVSARYTAEVDANSYEEAKKLSATKFSEANFGEAEDIDGKIVAVENDKGIYVWEK